MTGWQREIGHELHRAEGSQNPGRLRTTARRIAGIALQELLKHDPESPAARDYMSALRTFMKSENLPTKVSAAITRLEVRLSADFISQSIDPLGDAMLVVEFVRKELQGREKNGGGSNNPD